MIGASPTQPYFRIHGRDVLTNLLFMRKSSGDTATKHSQFTDLNEYLKRRRPIGFFDRDATRGLPGGYQQIVVVVVKIYSRQGKWYRGAAEPQQPPMPSFESLNQPVVTWRIQTAWSI